MKFIDKMKENAKKNAKTLVLAEGLEERTVKAARKIVDEGIAKKVYLVGPEKDVKAFAKKLKVDLTGIDVVDPATSKLREKANQEFFELRKKKGVTIEEATEKMSNPLFFAAMMVHLGEADSMVAGAENTTANVLRSAFWIVKTAQGINKASSCFVMITKQEHLGEKGSFIFSDCATIPDPSSEDLAEIAYGASLSCKKYLQAEPRVAFLSYSSKGSAASEMVDKVSKAVEIFHEKHPEIAADGELQLDAAIIPEVAKSKAPDSKVAGKANVLIFPDLQSGNIGYKLVQRLAGAEAYGPILQGFSKPVSDLSRGCSVDDIVATAALTLS